MKTTESIENRNKLIAEFEGYETYFENGYWFVQYDPDEFGNENERTLLDTHYHSSWDWLMPVVTKIETLSYEDERIYGHFEKTSFIYFIGQAIYVTIDLKGVYDEVCEFIERWNKQITKP